MDNGESLSGVGGRAAGVVYRGADSARTAMYNRVANTFPRRVGDRGINQQHATRFNNKEEHQDRQECREAKLDQGLTGAVLTRARLTRTARTFRIPTNSART